ncbi:hypothetical protein Tco_0805254 [Tanacetum coccineum]
MSYLVRAYYSISPTRYYKDDSCCSADLKSKTIEDVITIRSFMEVLVLNHYVLGRKILSYKLQFEEYLEIKRQRETYAREVDMEYNPSNLVFAEWLASKFYNHLEMDCPRRIPPWRVMTIGRQSQVWGGNPAKFLRKLTDKEMAFFSESASTYSKLAEVHATKNAEPLDQTDFLKVIQKKANQAKSLVQ